MDSKNALRVMKFDTEIAKTQYFDVEKRCRGLSYMQRVMEGLLPEVQCPIIANFYGKNVSKGEMYTFQHFEKMGCKKSAIYRVMRSVDAEETVAQEEGQGKPHKLTKAQEKKVTYCNHGKRGPLRDHSLFCIIELIRRQPSTSLKHFLHYVDVIYRC